MMQHTSTTLKALLIAGFVIGLAIKYSMLFYMGVSDMPSYFDWGKTTLEAGLIKAYHGIYFPLQYQFFAVCVWITSLVGSEYFVIFKASNLVFDIATFLVLLAILRREGLNPAYSLLYWLHPWFLSMFALGYIDFHFTFFVMLSVWALRDDSSKSWLLAGIPLGLAFVMKPQAMILIVAASFYCVVHLVRTADIKPFGLLAGPVVAFGAYEAFFTAAWFPLIRRAAVRVLPMSYLDITNVFPALNAQMTNIWYPIAFFMKKPGDQIFSISDNILIMPHVPVKYLAGAVVLTIVALQVFLSERNTSSTLSFRFIEIWGIATLTVPMLMTSAHENHLFLGSVFLVLLMVRRDSVLSMKIASHILLLVQFVSLYGLYGEHPVGIALFLRSYYSGQMATIYSVIATFCFFVILALVIRRSFRATSQPLQREMVVRGL